MGTSITPTGFEHAAAALRYWTRRQEVVANNLANVDTDGFKGERTFAQLLADVAGPVAGTATDLREGTLTMTGQPLDLAMGAHGFFVVDTAAGQRLSRGGPFAMDPEGRLMDARGHLVLGEDPSNAGRALPVSIPVHTAKIEIGRDGEVKADGKVVARLRVERPAEGATLEHAGDTLFAASTTVRVANEDRQVRQGARESSNVHPLEALVDMITVQRATGSVQKALTTLDAARGIAVSELGKSAQ